MATTREEMYRKFGPQLFEAMFRLLFVEINKLRQNAGLSQYTVQQSLDALNDEMNSTTKYDWM